MSVYQPFTTIHLIANVDTDVSYNHQYYFETQQAQYNFFYGKKVYTLDPASYQRKYVGCISAPYLAEDLKNIKYMMWKNLLNEDGSSPTGDTRQVYQGWIYAFVTKIEYVNPSLSNVYYVLDVYQTYLFDMTWKQSAVNRKHCHRWKDTAKRIPVFNIAEENLDYGSSYRITGTSALAQSGDSDTAYLILSTTKKITTNTHTNNMMSGIASQLFTYIIPFDTSSQGYNYTYGSDAVMLTDPRIILNVLATDTDLVNSLVSASIVPYIPYDITITDTSTSVANSKNITFSGSEKLGTDTVLNNTTYHILHVLGQHQFDEIELSKPGNDMYLDFPAYDESKLLMYPYSFTLLTNMRGDTMSLKTEFINHGIGKINIEVLGTVNFQHKIAYLIKDYLGTEGYNMDNSMGDSSTDNVPIIDDYTASYLQSNSNSIRVANANAKATYQAEQTMALNTYMTGNDTALNTLLSTEAQGAISMAGGIIQTGISFGQSGVSEITGGMSTMLGGLSDYSNAYANNELAYSNTMVSASTSYANNLATTYAKLQDAKQVPPSASNMTGDFIFNSAYNFDKVYLLQKTLQQQDAERLTDYFKEYGYRYDKIEIPDFHTRSSWNYIQMTVPNVSGNIPMDDLMKIRDIFMKGITLWHGDYIGNYSRDNTEIKCYYSYYAYPQAGGHFSSNVVNGQIEFNRADATSGTVTAIAETGYTFSKWSDGVTTATRTWNVSAGQNTDKVFEAIFTED